MNGSLFGFDIYVLFYIFILFVQKYKYTTNRLFLTNE